MGPADLLGERLLRQPEVIDELPIRVGLLERTEVRPLEVLDERELELMLIGELAHDRRDALETGEAAARTRRSPATSW